MTNGAHPAKAGTAQKSGAKKATRAKTTKGKTSDKAQARKRTG